MVFPEKLNNRLWHTTKVEHYSKIIECGFLLPEPEICDKDRWKTANGQKNYPFVRTLGGVSLFEFNEFDPDEYSKQYPSSSWDTFIPYRKEWKETIWIEIDKDEVGDNFICGNNLLKMWKDKKAYRHTVMPVIEAACIGRLSISAFKQVLVSNADSPVLKPYAKY